MKKWISFALTLFFMAVIFALSAQPGETSSALSGTVAEKVQNSAISGAAPPVFSNNLNSNMRKWAHVYIYCALGFSMGVTVCLFRQPKCGKRGHYAQNAALAVLFCLGYAALDEFHQMFVPARTALLPDIGIDALGFVPCVLLACVCVYWIRRLGTKKK